jgi:hypothetical protein
MAHGASPPPSPNVLKTIKEEEEDELPILEHPEKN